MKEARVAKLLEAVDWIAQNFTDISTGKAREFEKVVQIQPISDTGAIAIFEKASTGKRALAFFLWLEREGKFKWWFPSDSDFLFLNRAQAWREKVECFNAMRIAGRLK